MEDNKKEELNDNNELDNTSNDLDVVNNENNEDKDSENEKVIEDENNKDEIEIIESNKEEENIEENKDEKDENIDEKTIIKDIEKGDKELKAKKVKNLLFISGITLLSLIFLLIIATIFKLDSIIFPSSVFGSITDFSSRPLIDVKVCIQGKCSNTDNTGYYSIEGLKYGKYDFTAEKDKYRKYTETIDIQRGKNELNRQMQPFGFGEIKGKLIASSNLELSNLKIYLNDSLVEVNDNGQFIVSDKMIGTYTFKLESPFYQDFEVEFDLKEGLKDFGEIVLIDSRDITIEVIDWISDKPVKDAKAKINDIEILSNDSGLIEFKDIPVSLEYSFSINKDGYKQYSSVIKNVEAPNLIEKETSKIVREGKVVYVSSRLGNYNVYSSDYDGSNEKMLSDNKGSNYNPKLMDDNKTVYYLSTRDNIKDSYNNPVGLLYRVDVNGGGITKISKTNYSDNGSIGYFDYKSQKRVYSINSEDNTKRDVYFGNIDGTGMNKVYSISNDDGYFYQFLITPDGKSIIANLADYTESPSNKIFKLNPLNGIITNLYSIPLYEYTELSDISPDSKSLLFIGPSIDDNNKDIHRISIDIASSNKVTSNSAVESKALYGKDSKTVFFIDNRDMKFNLFKKGDNGSSEIKLTESGKVESIVQINNNIVFFIEDKSLMVIDYSISGVKAKKVTDNVTTYMNY